MLGKRGLLIVPLAMGFAAPAFADCQWRITGTIIDQTGVPVANKPVQLRSQPATGSAFEPQLTGPRETSVWPAAKTDGNGSFNVTSNAFAGAACTRSRMIGATVGAATDAGEVGPMQGPGEQGGVFAVQVGTMSVGVTRDEIR